jgi:hypothetical protein
MGCTAIPDSNESFLIAGDGDGIDSQWDTALPIHMAALCHHNPYSQDEKS